MSSCNNKTLFIFSLLCLELVLPVVISKTLPESPYDKFISFLLQNNCSMPKKLKHPFPESTNTESFSYLSFPLKECRKFNVSNKYDKAHMLCTEVFEVLKNISCVKYNESLPIIENNDLSTDVCHDFESLRDVLPRNDDVLSGRLTDTVVCNVMCNTEKYELLCKTLLWSYDTLIKIKHVLHSESQENGKKSISQNSLDSDNINVLHPESQENEKKITNEDSLGKDTAPVKTIEVSADPDSNFKNVKKPTNINVNDDLHPNQENTLESDSNQTDKNSHNPETSDELIPLDISSKKDLTDSQDDEVANNTAKISKTATDAVSQNKSETTDKKLFSGASENNVNPNESKTVPILNPPKSVDDGKNKIDAEEKPSQKEVNDNSPENLKVETLTTKDQSKKNATVDDLLKKGNDKYSNSSSVVTKSEESISPVVASDNKLKNNNDQEEEDSKSKPKPADVENGDVKEIEKPKPVDYEGSNEVLAENDSKLPESSPQSVLPEEDIDHEDAKDQEQYNDIENVGDYNVKPEYENAFNPSPKDKESEIKNSIDVNSDQMLNNYDNINAKKTIAQMTEEIAVIAPFPEQEDRHFFFYFLSIVLIIMAGYLVFHNKQKIIALIVEGRHERRRRSHGAGYKKLETK